MLKTVIGIDPGGSSGSVAVLDYQSGQVVSLTSFNGKKWWERECDIIREVVENSEVMVATVEKVAAMGQGKNGRRQGLSSTASFMTNFGWCHGVLMGCGLSRSKILEPMPQLWQSQMGCLTGGDKSISASFADRLFPIGSSLLYALPLKAGKTFSRSQADSLLLAEYGRLVALQNERSVSFRSLLDLRISQVEQKSS